MGFKQYAIWAGLPATHPVCNDVLAVELLSFTANTYERNIGLNWQTLTETNCDRYEIEHSVDAYNFSSIAAVSSKAAGGNSISLLQYSYVDTKALPGINYYRLKQIYRDGSSNLSRIISVNIAEYDDLTILVFPNYNSGEFTARLSGLGNTPEIALLLRNEAGDIVYRSLYFNSANEASVALSVVPENKLPKGNYVCSFVMNGVERFMKVIVAP